MQVHGEEARVQAKGTKLTSRMLNVEGYRKKKDTKLRPHTASCTNGWPLRV